MPCTKNYRAHGAVSCVVYSESAEQTKNKFKKKKQRPSESERVGEGKAQLPVRFQQPVVSSALFVYTRT